MYDRKLVQIGNSFGVTFPPEVLLELGFETGDWLRLDVEDKSLVITKSDLRARTKGHRNGIRRHRATLRK